MPTPAYTGAKPSYLLRPRWTSILMAATGTALSGAGIPKEVAQFFIREACALDYKRAGDTTVNKTLLGHFYNATVKLPILQQTWAEYLNALKLSAFPVQAAFATNQRDGTAYVINFVNNAGGTDPVGGTTPATGSNYLGITPKLTIDDAKFLLEIDGKTQLLDSEYEWQHNIANNATIAVGDSGGTALGIVAQTESRQKNLRAGIRANGFKLGGTSIGILKRGFKFEAQSLDTGAGDNKDVAYCDAIDVTMEVIARQLGPDTHTSWYAAANDLPIEADLNCGYKILCDAGALGLVDEAVIDEKDPMMKLTFKGQVMYPTSWSATPDTIDLGVTDPLTLQLHRIGY